MGNKKEVRCGCRHREEEHDFEDCSRCGGGVVCVGGFNGDCECDEYRPIKRRVRKP